jgi:pyruvate/2-oxoglutarate dehydrogenase complex dihydrolipoamide acyltransferase (E2) component
MSEDALTETPHQGPVAPLQPEATPRRRPRWFLPAGVVALGLLVGGGIGAGVIAGSTDPIRSTEYRALQQKLHNAESEEREAQQRATAVGAAAQEQATTVQQRNTELDQREAALAAREAAVTATEKQLAANSIEEGTWTVGVDVAPGTYRTSQPVGSDCYWKITKSGTNGGDIIKNDIPGGGIPTVTLSQGQDFSNQRCGTFVKQ